VRRVVEDVVRDTRRGAAAWPPRRRPPRRRAPPTPAGRRRRPPPDPARSAAARRATRPTSEAALAELAALGVECKGLDVGLVDFPAEVGGAPAYLCWQLGEPAVAWWHRPDAGFAGRRPLVELA
jgi:hypothetical protein